ncbi:hypothetical protein K504DRAFT_468120 [Pleomassaria siparia CBS 279.74]|uniref:Myb-like DNA-binding domain-containing protein n=1 Tax=Pleomassaria siparia CBS 279.74 TaxID=1314801 RepID=A0A6G1K7N2_9PLEO|nr:hypothetical protein K504DRAFT_468120 [Pleomassaria siparia CBS 279.74]
MPTDEENTLYLYLVLTDGGMPSIDFDEVGKSLNLQKGAVSKRWSRLKQAMNENKPPGPTAYPFLWLCIKHSSLKKAPDWNAIAKKCNTTPGAASKRYSRMKQAFETGAAAPNSAGGKGANNDAASPTKASPAKRKRAPATPRKKAAATTETDEDGVENVEDGMDVDEGEEESKPKPKRVRTPAKPRAKATPKGKKKGVNEEKTPNQKLGSVNPTEATTCTLIKTEGMGDGPAEGAEYYDGGNFMTGGEVGGDKEEGEVSIAQEQL